ncbi:unnamed protein product [Rotaria sp. Silwood1]|nr:unnamed protein product [Rotaria sp. Silwood1]CAF1478337.1 unnamed protein product [Rotaria sp. Silwood1]CAF1533221.1 unnamed protein product [Rotaria sp. Silwood1]CAF3675450.1 unnamed protein product [Rotaria sp. Silwood1]CAF4743951.1 unnamed protein product [Rotaria sp. Silwood1]
MATTLNELLGEQLLQHNESGDETSQIPTNQLNGKTIALYFSVHWCGPNRDFTPIFAEIFKKVDNEIKDKLDVVFISYDPDQASFDEYFKEMPWKALPFSDRDRSKALAKKFNIGDIACLIVLSPTCETITSDGIDEVRVSPDEALRRWTQGKRLFWSREPREGEFTWKRITCNQCFMNPFIGTRHGCTHEECQFNLCEICLLNNKHEHPLIEYLIPKKQYSLEELFKSVPHLLNSNNEEKIEIKTMRKDGIKSIGFYFSAHWCSPCRAFTPKLAEVYKEAQSSSQSFRIVFVSWDRDEESFNEYRSEMPWPAVPLKAGTALEAYFQCVAIPSLFVISSDGKVLSRRGNDDVLRKGVEAMKSWAQGKKLVPPSTDEFLWSDASCNSCNMDPLIGQRYRCLTCDYYDLCLACKNKGHEHPLELVPQPVDDQED